VRKIPSLPEGTTKKEKERKKSNVVLEWGLTWHEITHVKCPEAREPKNLEKQKCHIQSFLI
jgi:hypothetical protein